MYHKSLKYVLGIFTFLGLLTIDQVPDILVLSSKQPFINALLPVITFSLIWIMILLCESLGIFRLKDLRLKPEDLKIVLTWFLILLIVKLASATILALSGEITTRNQQLLDSFFKTTPVWLYYLLAGIAGPIMEEIIFRGYLINYYFAANRTLGILISSLIFCLLHRPTDLGSFLLYFSIGLVLGL